MKTKLLLIILLTFLGIGSKAQVNPCGMDELIERLKQKDSSFQQKFQKEEIKYKDWSKNSSGRAKFSERRSALGESEKKEEIYKGEQKNKSGFRGVTAVTGCPYDNTIYGPLASPTAINTISSISNMYGGQGVRVTGMIAGNTYRIYTCGQNDFDTELSLYSVGGGPCIAFNDNACANNQSKIYFTPSVSGSYDILLDEAPGCGGTYIVSTTIYVELAYMQGTCGYNNTLHGTSAAPQLNQTISFSQILGGEFNRVTNMIAGNTYRIYTCGNTAFDTQLSVFTAGGGQAVAFNDDACGGLQSEIYFTPLTTGNYDILLDAYPCSSNSINMDVNVTLIYTGRPIVTIPVVIHVLWNNSTENISNAQIQSQITVLNQDFNLQHSGLSTVPAQFRGECSNPLIQFCLAQRDPNGNATTGITRTFTSKQNFTLPDTDVYFTSLGGLDPWNKNEYLNIWVCNVAPGSPSGIAFPNNMSALFGTPAYLDGIGVVLYHKSFGTTGTVDPYFAYGKNTVHEIGHWLGLWHLWNDNTSNTCGSDSIIDTPPQDIATEGLPLNQTLFDYCTASFPGLMYFNYMDYPDDVVRNMFTYSQTYRMDYALGNWYSSIYNSQGCVPPITTGFNYQYLENNVSIYPNPNKGNFSIVQNDKNENLKLAITNVLGEIILEQNISESITKIELLNQPNGVYFIMISSDAGRTIKKIIVNK